jgi:hypothetical protein
LVSALRRARSGDIIYTSTLTIANDTVLDDAAAQENLVGLPTNVLVRPEPGARIYVPGVFKVEVPRVTWAFLEIGGSFQFQGGASRSRLARSKLTGAGSIFAIVAHTGQLQDIEFVEVVAPNRGVGNDRVDIYAYQSPNVPTDIKFIRCWFEGVDPVPKAHSDTMQWDAGGGTMFLKDTYLGPAGNNATMQIGAEQQPNGLPYAAFVLDTVFLGGALIYGNGNQLYKLGPSKYLNVEWYGNISVFKRLNTVAPTVVQGNRIPGDPKLADGRAMSVDYPANQYRVKVTMPEFEAPPWWW